MGSTFPWPMIRKSLAALIPGFQQAERWRERAFVPGIKATDTVIALFLAGNTPLLAWPTLAACLLAGRPVFVKMSRYETLWPRLFLEALAEIDPELAALIHLDVWPGEDPRTAVLLESVDGVIAYGSDGTLDALRSLTPLRIRFFGYGHAISVGLVLGDTPFSEDTARGFACDVLMYDQQGCLSPQAIFCEGGPHRCAEVGALLGNVLAKEADLLAVSPVTDASIAHKVREARDIALFNGFSVIGEEGLRWTVVILAEPTPLPEPVVTHGVVYVIPLLDGVHRLGEQFSWAQGRVSCVGVSGEVTQAWRESLEYEGLSRICLPGEMQTPPLDWPNGNRDLLTELCLVGRSYRAPE